MPSVSFNSLSYGSHRWRFIQSLAFNTIFGPQMLKSAPWVPSTIKLKSNSLALHSRLFPLRHHGPHPGPGPHIPRPPTSQDCQDSPCLQCPPSLGPTFPPHTSVPVLEASQMLSPSELPQAFSSHPHSLPSPTSSGMRFCTPPIVSPTPPRPARL